MKMKLYYALPFIAVPIIMLLCELLDNTKLLKMNPYIIGVILVLTSAVFGFFSPSKKSVDYLITIIMPLSLFLFMFIGGFLSKNDLETRFHLSEAAGVSLQPISLVLYLAMAVVALVSSLKFFRNLKIHTKI